MKSNRAIISGLLFISAISQASVVSRAVGTVQDAAEDTAYMAGNVVQNTVGAKSDWRYIDKTDRTREYRRLANTLQQNAEQLKNSIAYQQDQNVLSSTNNKLQLLIKRVKKQSTSQVLQDKIHDVYQNLQKAMDLSAAEHAKVLVNIIDTITTLANRNMNFTNRVLAARQFKNIHNDIQKQ